MLLCVQVAWNKAELSAHDMEPEQQERLFAGKHHAPQLLGLSFDLLMGCH